MARGSGFFHSALCCRGHPGCGCRDARPPGCGRTARRADGRLFTPLPAGRWEPLGKKLLITHARVWDRCFISPVSRSGGAGSRGTPSWQWAGVPAAPRPGHRSFSPVAGSRPSRCPACLTVVVSVSISRSPPVPPPHTHTVSFVEETRVHVPSPTFWASLIVSPLLRAPLERTPRTSCRAPQRRQGPAPVAASFGGAAGRHSCVRPPGGVSVSLRQFATPTHEFAGGCKRIAIITLSNF